MRVAFYNANLVLYGLPIYFLCTLIAQIGFFYLVGKIDSQAAILSMSGLMLYYTFLNYKLFGSFDWVNKSLSILWLITFLRFSISTLTSRWFFSLTEICLLLNVTQVIIMMFLLSLSDMLKVKGYAQISRYALLLGLIIITLMAILHQFVVVPFLKI